MITWEHKNEINARMTKTVKTHITGLAKTDGTKYVNGILQMLQISQCVQYNGNTEIWRW